MIGTLTATVITQSRADRMKRLELRTMVDQQAAERAHAESRHRVEQAENERRDASQRKRACYIALNTAARQYLSAQDAMLHALRAGAGKDDAVAELEVVRRDYRACYAEAQMTLPLPVLVRARPIDRSLNRTFGHLKRRALYGAARLTLEEVGVLLDENWVCLEELLHIMRDDLGIDPVPQGPSPTN
ncbi:hypothetical protein [Streptomyces sp. NPDC020362]|uniref:hypothetical protein n=1 Tax=unclassified Streptomyces TaxID=2593676 RepID=UPI000A96FC31